MDSKGRVLRETLQKAVFGVLPSSSRQGVQPKPLCAFSTLHEPNAYSPCSGEGLWLHWPVLRTPLSRLGSDPTSAERARHEVAGACQNFHMNIMDLCHWEQKCICILRGERPREKSAVYRTCTLYQPAPISR